MTIISKKGCRCTRWLCVSIAIHHSLHEKTLCNPTSMGSVIAVSVPFRVFNDAALKIRLLTLRPV